MQDINYCFENKHSSDVESEDHFKEEKNGFLGLPGSKQ